MPNLSYSRMPILKVLITSLLFLLVTGCGGGSSGNGVLPIQRHLLTLQITGTGKVQSQPSGINCTSSCNAEFAQATSVTLTATAGAGYTFTGWTGACSGSAATCVVNMDQARTVSSTFTAATNPTQLALSVNISGSGSVTSAPAGINCTANCNANFASNTQVTLTATPSANFSFSGWGGVCTGTNSTCTVTMSQARAVTATFAPVPANNFALSVSVTGSGSVQSNPAGINCGATCSANFAANTSVVLTATPASGSIFSSWGGACTGTTATCTVALSQARQVQATFTTAPTSGSFQAPQLLESSNDFNVADTNQFADVDMLVAVNNRGDGIVIWEQSDGTPNGNTIKTFSRRYSIDSGWQTPVAVPNLTTTNNFHSGMVTGHLFMDDTGVATWIRPNMETRRNSPSTGWAAPFSPSPAIPSAFYNQLTSAVMDASGNIGVIISGGNVYNMALAPSGQWGTLARVDNAGTLKGMNGQVALSSNGTAIAIWRERNPGDTNYSMKAARYNPTGGWGTPESIETAFTNVTDSTPRIVIDAQGNGIAMWQQGSNNTLHYNIYRAGSGWQGAVEMTNETRNLGGSNIQLAMTPDGRAIATWTLELATLRSMQYSPTSGWSTPVTVDTYNTNRSMRINQNGQAVLVYSPTIDSANPNWNLISRKLTFGSQWSTPSLVENGAGDVKEARFAMNKNGQGILIWAQTDAANSNARNSLWSAVLR